MSSFLTPSQIQAAYFQILKSIKPSINTNDQNSDFVIRGNVFSGIVSGLYGDQAKVDNDSFVTSMRSESLDLKGQDYGITRQPATQSNGPQVRIYGTNGVIVGIGAITFLYEATNTIYSNISGGTITGGFLDLQVRCETTGQIGNILAPDVLTVISPPPSVATSSDVLQSIADGSDTESDDSYRARLLSRLQSPPAGGNETDYPLFAFAADPSVRSAVIFRFGRGLGTVDIYITTGTTNIDDAITQGLPVIRIPSPTVIATVQAYYNSHAPLTDCPAVFAPSQLTVDVTMNVNLASGLTLSSVPADPINNPLNLNVGQLIQREVSRALYKNPIGGRILPSSTNGFVVASAIEESIDVWLSAAKDSTGNYVGKIPVLSDRQCQKLDGVNYNKVILKNELAAPGTITTVLGV